MVFTWVLAIVLFLFSWFTDREKSVKAARVAWSLFRGILPVFIIVLVLTSLSLGLIREDVILDLLSGKGLLAGTVIGAFAGSVAAIPGFVAFPLSGILLGKGVPYTVIAAFTTTLMMVGVVTFPLEKRFLGARVALVRNFAGLAVALVVSVAIGLFFGELP